MALSDAQLRALKPRATTFTISDGQGLYVEVFPTGGVVWRYRYRLSGRQEKLTLGKYPALTLKNARLKRGEAAQLVAMGNSPAAGKQAAKANRAQAPTIRVFGERFFREVVAKDRKSITIPRRYFDKAIVPELGGKRLADVSSEDVRRVIWRKKDEGFDAAAGNIRGLLKRMFDYAMTCGIASSNPVLSMPMRHIYKAKSRERALSADELRVFLKGVFESNMRRQFKVGIQLILLTMVRKSELLLARWENVDLKRAEWCIPAGDSKTGKPHVVFLSLQAVSLFSELQALAGDSKLVMPGRGSQTKPFAHNGMNTALRNALSGVEIAHFTIHDLRRTASTHLHEQGWPSDVVEKALNHTAGGVRGVYNRAEYSLQRKEMLQAWGDFIQDVMSGGSGALVRFRPVGLLASP